MNWLRWNFVQFTRLFFVSLVDPLLSLSLLMISRMIMVWNKWVETNCTPFLHSFRSSVKAEDVHTQQHTISWGLVWGAVYRPSTAPHLSREMVNFDGILSSIPILSRHLLLSRTVSIPSPSFNRTVIGVGHCLIVLPLSSFLVISPFHRHVFIKMSE